MDTQAALAPRITPEAVRLVVWDLDDTFWDGTLSEAGITWRADHAEIVRALSRRGIVNSICSKNDLAQAEAVLRRHGLWDEFVFPSISWDPKGPRLRDLAEAAQLRPQTILFIDDNPMNPGEAAYHVPGLQTAEHTVVPHLLDDPRLAGQPDPEMRRLAQYKLLERRQTERRRAGGDTAAFLRESGITVQVEHDVAAHEDRAIELINRTNQLNFTKRRLPEDAGAARTALRALLARHTVQAGLVRVRDRYGDHGFAGLYIQASDQSNPRPYLLHFTFSCRILGMGVETWLYQRLGRPILQVRGEVLTDVAADTRPIDWIGTGADGRTDAEAARPLAYTLVRGGCDMRALAHYFSAISDRVIDDAAAVREGGVRLTCSVLFTRHALRGAPSTLVRDAAPLGFLPEDFRSTVAHPPDTAGRPAAWLLNLHFEQPIPVLRHRETGGLIPASIAGATGQQLNRLVSAPETSGLDPALLDHIRAKFEVLGPLPDDLYRAHLSDVLAAAPPTVRVFIILANEQGRDRVLQPMRHRNALSAEVARGFARTEVIRPADVMSADEILALETPHHYDRLAYFRMFEQMRRLLPA